MTDECRWRQHDTWECCALWDTDCGETFVINEDTPAENDMRFCCFCGKPLRQVLAQIDDDGLRE